MDCRRISPIVVQASSLRRSRLEARTTRTLEGRCADRQFLAAYALAIAIAFNSWSQQPNPSSDIREIATVGKYVVFSANDKVYGIELWRYDTQAHETSLIMDICSGIRPSNPERFFTWNNTLYFGAYDGIHNVELWRTDGTADGTRLICDINRAGKGSQPQLFVDKGDSLLFVADDGIHGLELWRTDGTYEGTALIEDLHPPGNLQGTTFPPAILGNEAFFRVATIDGQGQLWRTDGTAQNTYRINVQDFDLEAYRSRMVRLRNILVFSAGSPGAGLELWRTDGSIERTFLVRDIMVGSGDSDISEFERFGDRILFHASDAEHGSELWMTDGTPEGTVLIKDIVTGSAGSDPYPIRVAGAHAFFTAATPESGRELWVTDGTTAGTRQVADIYPGTQGSQPYAITTNGSTIFFSANDGAHGEELWMSDGTTSGTRLVADIFPGDQSSAPYHLAVMDGVAYFSANDGRHGEEFWRSDGTANGTYLLADIAQPVFGSVSSNPMLLTRGSDLLFFIEREADGLWRWCRSDGSEEGTYPLTNEVTGETSAVFQSMCAIATGMYSVYSDDGLLKLWFSEGSVVGTHFVADIGRIADEQQQGSMAAIGDALYFVKEDASGELGLWCIQKPGAAPTAQSPPGIRPASLTPDGHRLFFVAHDNAHGEELWIHDDDGSRMVVDLNPGIADAAPRELVSNGGALYFTANDGMHGPEIWTTDGTAAKTRMVTDVNPMQHTDAEPPTELTPTADALYFVANDGQHGRELWKADLKSGAASLLKDVYYGKPSSNPELLTMVDGKLYFRAEQLGAGVELFVSDGSTAGTRIVKDHCPGSVSSQPMYLTPFDGQLFLVMNSQFFEGSERELRCTDGMQIKMYDVRGGIGGSNATELKVVNKVLFMSAEGGDFGKELWKLESSSKGLEAKLVRRIVPAPRKFVAPHP